MSDGKIQVKNEALYTITVNGIEDLIKLDLTDLSLPAKIMDLIDRCEKQDKIVEEKINELVKGKKTIKDNETMVAITKIMNQECNELRKIVDEFLGEGVCMAIFGETNYINMFTDLFDALKPELNKAIKKGNMSIEKMQKTLGNKYKKKVSKTI